MLERLLGIDAPDGAEAQGWVGQIEEAQRLGFCLMTPRQAAKSGQEKTKYRATD
jgi:hypothetical protein